MSNSYYLAFTDDRYVGEVPFKKFIEYIEQHPEIKYIAFHNSLWVRGGIYNPWIPVLDKPEKIKLLLMLLGKWE